MQNTSSSFGAGTGTKDRLRAAVERLLLSKEDANVSLREITDSAGANVAAVHYHFRTKDALVHEVIESALRRHANEQLTALKALTAGSQILQVEDIISAWLAPSLLNNGTQPHTVITHIAGRAKSEPIRDLTDRPHAKVRTQLIALLAVSLRYLDQDELEFRVTLARILVSGLMCSTLGIPIISYSMNLTKSKGTSTRLVSCLVGLFTAPFPHAKGNGAKRVITG